MAESRLVVGAGGTGRTHRLTRWLDELGVSAKVISASPLALTTADDVAGALAASADVLAIDDLQWFEAAALKAVVAAAKGSTTVLATRRPDGGEPPELRDLLDLIGDLLAQVHPAERLDLVADIDAYAPVLAHMKAAAGGGGKAMPSDEVERYHTATGGSLGLTADAIAIGWNGEDDRITTGLIDAVNGRVRRAGQEAVQLVQLLTLAADDGAPDADDLAVAVRALPDGVDPSRAERGMRAGGLVGDDGRLLPLISTCVTGGLTATDRAGLHDQIAAALAGIDDAEAARHLLDGDGAVEDAPQILASTALGLAVSNPAEAPRYIERAEQLGLPTEDGYLLRALGAFHAGSADALAHLDAAISEAGGVGDDRMALLGFGIDVRELRFDTAASRPVVGDLAQPLSLLARGLAGEIDPDSKASGPDVKRSPLAAVVAGMGYAINDLANGSFPKAIAGFSTGADDYDRLAPTAPFGMTPHVVGALGALVVGDLSVVEILTNQAIDRTSGGIGEALSHRLVRAYGRLVAGDYGEALALLRELAGVDADTGRSAGRDATTGDRAAEDRAVEDSAAEDGAADNSASDNATGGLPLSAQAQFCQRDRLLLASLEAAIARRSGDTTRLRSAWRRAEAALIRPSTSWLLLDPLAELLAAGARVGDARRVDPVVDAVVETGRGLPPSGPGLISALWLKLQVAIAAEDRATISSTTTELEACDPGDERSKARLAAAAIWAAIAGIEGERARPSEAEVVVVAEQLSATGDGWEASRVLGQAALDEPDPKAARRMLEMARISATEHVDESSGEGLAALGLSEREAEVALLVIEGRTHKEVGAQLFISPKTVEHHVAKIRQKVGAGSRAELLSIIREAVGNV